VPALDPDEAGDLPRLEVPLDVGGGERRGEGLPVLVAQPVDEIDLLERVHRRVLAPVNRGDGHVRRPELGAHPPGTQLGNVGHERGLPHREIHGIEAAPLADGVGDVVVAVEERDRPQDAQGLGAVVLRCKAGGR